MLVFVICHFAVPVCFWGSDFSVMRHVSHIPAIQSSEGLTSPASMGQFGFVLLFSYSKYIVLSGISRAEGLIEAC